MDTYKSTPSPTMRFAPPVVDREDSRVSKFYEAINQYASEQRRQIEEEVAEYKERELEAATNQVLSETYELIQKEMASMAAGIAREMAMREFNGRRELLKRRKEITAEIFDRAAKSLAAYAGSDQYQSFLQKTARKMKPLFTAGDTVVYLRAEDLQYQDVLEPVFGRCIFRADKRIHLGGLRVESSTLGLVADETFDSLLESQRDWFEETSRLEVV